MMERKLPKLALYQAELRPVRPKVARRKAFRNAGHPREALRMEPGTPKGGPDALRKPAPRRRHEPVTRPGTGHPGGEQERVVTGYS
jgi:hypothetical protein